MKKAYILKLLLILTFGNILAQKDSVNKEIPKKLTEYLSDVAKGNLSYIAEQFNVSIAEAELKASKVFPDPDLSLGYENNDDKNMKLGQSYSLGLGYNFSLGNKRGAEIAFAKSKLQLTEAALNAYFQNLRADAAILYYSSLKEKKKSSVQEDTYQRLKKLAQADSIRLKTGSIMNIDALQSSLEARNQMNQVYQSLADEKTSYISLASLSGKKSIDTLIVPSVDFEILSQNHQLKDLIELALQNRADLQVAMRNKELSEKNIRLVKAGRAFELGLSIGYSYNTEAKNDMAPSPSHKAYSAGLSIPLKFSLFNNGEVLAARHALSQSEVAYKEVELQITSDVTKAYFLYQSMEKQVLQYQKGMLSDAEKILEAKTYSYQRGETSLLEVLNAQHTFNDLRLSYYDAMCDYTTAFIELQRAVGIWELKQ